MAPNRKKKKPAANPARGFATTSIPSKPKAEKTVEAEPKASKEEQLSTAEPGPQTSTEVATPSERVTQTPEELEAQLERDELQLLVEKHASKIRRETNRQISKIQTDRRTLRPQSQFIPISEWLPADIFHDVVSLAQAESNDSNRRQGQPLLKVLPEEDAMAKLWTLKLLLGDLGFSDDHVRTVSKWLCANAASIDPSASIWGFQESLEWLALNSTDDHAFSYDDSKPKRRVETSPSTTGKPLKDNVDAPAGNVSTLSTPGAPASRSSTPSASEQDQIVSDLESDIEPDELVSTYLRVKSKLYQLDPGATDVESRRPAKGRNAKLPATKPSANVKKLLAQLQQLESDALFDKDEAEGLWYERRNQIAQEKAAERKLNVSEIDDEGLQDQRTQRDSAIGKDNVAEDSGSEGAANLFEEDDGMLGDMFAAVPDQSAPVPLKDDSPASGAITIRDFGKQSGLTPQRLLEEAVRARDPGARLSYKVVSENVYSCRSSLTIKWSKLPDLVYEEHVPTIICNFRTRQAVFTASTISTVSVQQSDSYVATAALFSIFSSSLREEKIYLRLPSNWRDLYREFLEHQKDRVDAADRNTIKDLRSLIQEQVEDDELGGVVLTSRFKMRNQASATNSVASDSGRNTPTQAGEGLKDLWKLKSSTDTYRRMFQVRSNLPVFGFRETVLSTVDKYQVTIICGETGCGKSTQIPSFILEHELLQGKECKIYCTEPRRISAISLAQRVSEELGEGARELGTLRSLVGYAIRLETKASAQTRLMYATVGVVLRMLESSTNLNEVTHLIIDEVHERSIDTDFLLIVLRSLMIVRPTLKVVLMSATVDSQRFSQYLDNAPVLNIPGRTFPVETKYLEDAIELTHYTTNAGKKINDSDTSGNEEEGDTAKEKSGIPSKLPGYSPTTRNVLSSYDEYAIDYDLISQRFSNAFLVFLPGIAEIRHLNDMLLGHPAFDKNWLIYPLHSTISSEEQQAAFVLPPPGVRKIVIATNIAETGVTIPDITCVVDTGKHKEMRFDERRQLSRLTQSFISRANAKQRRGRAGRVQEGLCFHLFTRHRHDNLMTDQQTPEMLRLSLQDLVMRTKICKLGDIEQTLSEALDPPSSRNIRRAIDALIEVDALTQGEELTPLGRQLAKLPLDAHLGKLVLLSGLFGCVDVAITIAAILSSKSPFLTPFGARQRADIARLAFKKGDSDLLTAYNAYKSWKATCLTSGRSEMQFCHKNFLSAQNLGNIEDLKAQLLSSLVDAGFLQLSVEERRALSRYRSTARHRAFVTVPAQYDTHSDNDILVNSVVAAALYPKILIKDGKGWRNISNNQTVSLAPTSVNKVTSINPSTAKFLSYYHIMQSTSKFYNAHSTSIVHPLPMILMVGADIDFKLHAGVISLQGNNVLRFSVQDWRVAVALKVLRRRVKEILTAGWKNPGRALSGREKEWLGLYFRVFEGKWEKEERVRERAGQGKGK
ncbi:P-loop containing nucleoside triphosphate hydrolase protein [Lophiotrema nucula]|uniref:RNA helicase n=1 Tax=Lophiotrema nucula TaxID=690887 RepID=A0A6A5YNU8_9PLEO|nr:P-loop containing nucleoside triphosphate hydrolase protein [Lophiotrema nucula]